MRWLWSPAAIQSHIACIALGVIFVWELIAGNPGDPKRTEYKLGLLFVAVVYPALLFLIRLQYRHAIKEIEKELASPTPPAVALSQRRKWRQHSISFLFAGAAYFVWAGTRGVLINGIPGEYLGYILAVTGVLGLFGINVWFGGPLDLRLDRHDRELLQKSSSTMTDESNEVLDIESKS